MDRDKLIARFIAMHGVRNTFLEDLHSGITPSSKKRNYSDVKVVTPYGEIPWNKLSRISDKEMRKLMLDVEASIFRALKAIPKLEKMAKSKREFEKLLQNALFDQAGISWDRPEHLLPSSLQNTSGKKKKAT